MHARIKLQPNFAIPTFQGLG